MLLIQRHNYLCIAVPHSNDILRPQIGPANLTYFFYPESNIYITEYSIHITIMTYDCVFDSDKTIQYRGLVLGGFETKVILNLNIFF